MLSRYALGHLSLDYCFIIGQTWGYVLLLDKLSTNNFIANIFYINSKILTSNCYISVTCRLNLLYYNDYNY